mmetsp:Transcript_83653/g.157476  ORF Transcript_83653/g.157476 Transcript_83653/m.157476 type:complete len:80 (-) Transcript_83653:1104-1343(-)
MIAPSVDVLFKRDCTSPDVNFGFCPKNKATTPETCGAAMEVPDFDASAVSDAIPADRMFTPGANMSTHAPVFENEALRS